MIKLSLIPLFLFAFTGLASSAPDGNLSPTSDEAKEVAQHWLESFADGLKQSGAKDVKVGKIGIEDEVPLLSPSSILPPSFRHDPAGQIFARNITGRYRGAQVHPLSLSSPPARTQHSSYWSSLNPPFNTNLPITPPDDDQKPADKWRWQDTTRLDMSFIETAPIGINHIKASSGESPFYSWGTGDWLFAEGSLTLTSASPALLGLWNNEDVVRYDFYGMHYIPNGTINLYALPRGKHILPITSKVPDWGQGNILDGLVTDLSEKMDVKKQLAWYSHVWFNTPFDIEEKGLVTECPLSIHITFPPSADLAKSNITSTNTDYVLSSPRLAGVAIAEGCGWALGFEGGGFFEPTSFIRYQNVFLIITYLVAGLKPFIRAPGTIVASVPTLTTWFMLLADCLVMLHAGGHGIREKIGKEEVMVVMIYLASQCCVTLFEYNEFCAGYWPHVRVVPSPLGLLLGLLRRREEGRHNRPWVLPRRVFFQWLIVLLPLFWVTFPYIFSPRIFPLVLFAASSFWTPSILSSAFTGVTYRWNWQFVLGQTIVRSGLLLCDCLSCSLYVCLGEKSVFDKAEEVGLDHCFLASRPDLGIVSADSKETRLFFAEEYGVTKAQLSTYNCAGFARRKGLRMSDLLRDRLSSCAGHHPDALFRTTGQ
ncbi:hypothetical protein, variant [Cryptococcus amylolentus CBS 6039]|uniref:Uncharacterized protein n=1 Tax=Cryptococcus amylolentus CBS 6039 TaxID=1295533 RepID=A0A1E3HEG2_9TREE|nr:hypothetical protein, variant [Cryptococcus amylolentus CBS 6039]ODN74704.1 hypothetical protein, variant [Cryptococcus amylolentus CBS 6039]